MPASPAIWIFGGRGDVGVRLATILTMQTRRSIVLCSRDGEKASAVAQHIGERVKGYGLDLSCATAVTSVSPGSSVINLTEATHPDFAKAAVRTGGTFIESAATPDYVRLVYKAAQVAGRGLVVVNAGLMPGLSNVLTDALGKNVAKVTTADVVIEMGMGRHYGEAATRWMIRSLGDSYDAFDNCAAQKVLPGDLRRSVLFGEDQTAKPALGFPFSVQLDVADSELEAVRSYLAIEPAWMTRLIGALLRLRLGKHVSRADAKIERFLRRMPVVGRRKTRLFVEGLDRDGKPIASVQVTSGDQADLTAQMLAETLAVAEGASRRGVVETQHVMKPARALKTVKRASPNTDVFFSSQAVEDAVMSGKKVK
ncbi:MAG: hypothetical protein AAFW87_01555 [Pseudomonadota bacterium]